MKQSVLLGLFLVACVEQAPTPDVSVSSLAQSIYGGTQDNNDPAVFGLLMTMPDGQGACTATLIGQRTLLTAAHCADGATKILATNKTFFPQNQSEYLEVTKALVHPGWGGQPGENADDLALLLLKSSQTITPKQWNMQAGNIGSGKAVRLVGYGVDENGASETKKQTAQTIDDVSAHLLFFDQRNGHGVCQGDSGGPVFVTGNDGVERVVGVASFVSAMQEGQDACATLGAHTRVDVYSTWITQWMAANETPTCNRDGLCKQNCTTPDLDCTCAADGQCPATCTDPTADPDCGPNCGADGVCSAAADKCPGADVDCKDLGELCAKPLDCPGRLCTNDSQHSQNYCSLACSASVKCPAGFECSSKICKKEKQPEKDPGEACTKDVDFCTSYTTCAGEPSTCLEECLTDTDCTEDKNRCTGKDGALKFCVATKTKETPSTTGSGTAESGTKSPPGTTPTTAKTQDPEPVKTGCSSTAPANAWVLLFSLFVLFARRRRA